MLRKPWLPYCLWLTSIPAFADPPLPQLQLATTLDSDAALATLPFSQYWFAEKYDGVRGYWDGQQLLSRQGQPISAPDWFLAALPAFAVEGELWLGRQRFAELSGLVRQHEPDDTAWRAVRFMLFDLPQQTGSYLERHARLSQWVAKANASFLHAVALSPVRDTAQLQQALRQVQQSGGEGLMLYQGDAPYISGRSRSIVKLKGYDEAEAKVVGYHPGQGKYQGLVGALVVELPDGRRFRLGSGLSDRERQQPPALGSWVTFRYNGLTRHQKPRFARFMRVREAH